MNDNIFKTLAPGFVSLLLCIVATLVSGFIVGFEATRDITLLVMSAMFMYPSPYYLLLAIGGAIYHSKRWRPIALTFNIGGILMLCMWVFNVLLSDTVALENQNPLNAALESNFYYSGGLFLVFLLVIIIEAQIAWPDRPLDD